jgi:ABC-2 type transport system permease protein
LAWRPSRSFIVLAFATTPAGLPPAAWLRLGMSVLAAGIVMSLFGIALGYSASPKAAVPIANLLYIGLSFGGGLFLPPQQLPKIFEPISCVLPTRQFGELAWSAVLGLDWPAISWLWVGGFAVVFTAAAFYAYRRDEGSKYL